MHISKQIEAIFVIALYFKSDKLLSNHYKFIKIKSDSKFIKIKSD